MLDFLQSRRRQAEWMDAPDVDPEHLRQSLRFIQRVNRFLGYTRATLDHLKAFSHRWKGGQSITIADFATGSADIPRAILDWAIPAGFDVRVVGIDLHAATAHIATSALSSSQSDGRLRIVRGDALMPPLADASVDYAITAMFLHHLSDEQVVRVLREMNRVARRGVIVADLLRNRRAYAWIKLLTLASNPMIRHDASVSVAQAFTKAEVLAYREAAGLSYVQFHHHRAHRFVLAGEKA